MLVSGLMIVGLESKILPNPPLDSRVVKIVGGAVPEVQVLCPDSALGVGDLGGTFSTLLQVDQDLYSP